MIRPLSLTYGRQLAGKYFALAVLVHFQPATATLVPEVNPAAVIAVVNAASE